MPSQRLRVEIIRFALLLVVTVGLISVAQRAFDDHKQSTGATGSPSTSATPPSGGTTSAPPTTTSPSSRPTTSGPTTGGSGSGGAVGGSAGSGGSTEAGSGGSINAAGQPILPRTGPDGAVRLAGFAFVLIAAGSLSVAGTRRKA